ncbi:alpha/beta fold hydrolase [Sinorhizobium medicae]
MDRSRALRSANGGQIADTAAGPVEYAERGDGIPLLSITAQVAGRIRIRPTLPIRSEWFSGDRPYFGTPIPGDSSPAARADAHVAPLSELQIDIAVVVGVSAGARSAVDLALRHPDKILALILIVPGTCAPESPVMSSGFVAARSLPRRAAAGG